MHGCDARERLQSDYCAATEADRSLDCHCPESERSGRPQQTCKTVSSQPLNSLAALQNLNSAILKWLRAPAEIGAGCSCPADCHSVFFAREPDKFQAVNLFAGSIPAPDSSN